MSAKSGGSFATVLLTVPLTAIAMMAMYGVPEFSSVIASPESGDVIRQPEFGDSALGQSADSAPLYRSGDNWGGTSSPNEGYSSDPFSDPRSQPPAYHPVEPPQANSGIRTSLGSHLEQEMEAPQQGDPQGWRYETPSRTAPNSHVSMPLDWMTANRRLSEMGIDRFHLERAATSDAFLFVAVVTPADTPNVTHRFEAEHREPLQAVDNVLNQIDHWLQARYAQNSFPNRHMMSAR